MIDIGITIALVCASLGFTAGFFVGFRTGWLQRSQSIQTMQHEVFRNNHELEKALGSILPILERMNKESSEPPTITLTYVQPDKKGD